MLRDWRTKERYLLLLLIALTGFITSGCSVFMAVKQPDYKNMQVLDKGTSRSEVIAELGTPLLSEEKDGKKKDLFVFKQGYGKGNKTLRAMFHGVADVFSLGLWEVIGTPAEAIANGREMKIEVFYDEKEYVTQVNILNEQKEKPEKQSQAEPQEKEELKDNKEPNKNFGP